MSHWMVNLYSYICVCVCVYVCMVCLSIFLYVVNSGSWWWTGRPDMLRFMGSQRVGHNWATDLIWSDAYVCIFTHMYVCLYTHIHMCFFNACWQLLSDFIYFIFVFAGSLLLHRFFGTCGKWGLLCSFGVWASYGSEFSCCRSQALGCLGFGNCSTWLSSSGLPQALEHRLN